MTSLPTIDDYPARLSFRFCPLCATPLVRRMSTEGERLVCPADGSSVGEPEFFYDRTSTAWHALWRQNVGSCVTRISVQRFDPVAGTLTGSQRQLISADDPAMGFDDTAAGKTARLLRQPKRFDVRVGQKAFTDAVANAYGSSSDGDDWDRDARGDISNSGSGWRFGADS